jgi:hypothetical protein
VQAAAAARRVPHSGFRSRPGEEAPFVSGAPLGKSLRASRAALLLMFAGERSKVKIDGQAKDAPCSKEAGLSETTRLRRVEWKPNGCSAPTRKSSNR